MKLSGLLGLPATCMVTNFSRNEAMEETLPLGDTGL
jgi:hypothetical protein